MVIKRISTNLSTSEKIRQLNEQIMELNGKIEQAKFNKVELDAVFTRGNVTDRKFLRNQSLGNTLGTYTGWSHLVSETGYSIWKFTPTNYAYNALNQLYLDDALLSNEGEATSESDSGDSVESLLALSAEDIVAGNWAWCTYNGEVYVTLRNSGATSYEGDFFICSSSSDGNLQNYFIYNHIISGDYQDATYVP